jgi:ribosome maturation factor RimP
LQGPSRLEQLLNPAVEAAGYRLVRLRVSGGRRKTVQVMAERLDGHMGVDDCATLSRALGEVLEAADPFDGEYVLEVSSPGIDRPLTRPEDFARFAGHEARIELTHPAQNGRRRFKGLLIGAEGNDIVLDVADEKGSHERHRFAFSAIADAKLVLTDKLIAEDLKRKASFGASRTEDGEEFSKASEARGTSG